MNINYLSPAIPICYDGEDEPEKTFTQTEVNSLMANHKRDLRERLEAAELRVKEFESGSHTESAERDKKWETKLAEANTAASQKLAELEQTYQTKLSESETRFKTLQAESHSYRIKNELLSAAAKGDAFHPPQLLAMLNPLSTINESGAVVVCLEGREFSPTEAVSFMKANPEFGNLFKANVIGGIGSNSTAGGGRPRPVDVRNLSAEQYRKLRATSPHVLGLSGGDK